MLFYIIGGYQCFDKVIEFQTSFNENELLYSCYISCTVSIENEIDKDKPFFEYIVRFLNMINPIS